MKKVLGFMLIMLLAGSFAFASAQRDASAFRVDVFWYTFADTFLASVRNSMLEQEAAMPNLRVTHHDSANNQTQQLQMIQTAITQGTSLLIVNIVTTGSEDTAMNIANLARDANVPVIFFNREVSDAVIRSYSNAAFVGTDADEEDICRAKPLPITC